MTAAPLPAVFVSHGGGPWPWMDGPFRAMHARLEASLRALPALLERPPRAVLLVSAHWEEPTFTLGGAATHALLFDYSGFPEETYRLRYPARGEPPLAGRAAALLRSAGLPAALDTTRGLDHGAFVPLALAWPGAEIPVVPMSLRAGLDPAEHLRAGAALAPLRGEGVLLLASGSSYHNLRDRGREGAAPSAAFDHWLQQVLVRDPPAARAASLIDWAGAPSAAIAHPREEHLLPLMVAVGAAGDAPGRCIFHEAQSFGYASVSHFAFMAATRETSQSRS